MVFLQLNRLPRSLNTKLVLGLVGGDRVLDLYGLARGRPRKGDVGQLWTGWNGRNRSETNKCIETARPTLRDYQLVKMVGKWSLMVLISLWWKKQILHGINLYADKGQKWPLSERIAVERQLSPTDQPLHYIQSGMITYDGIDIKLIEKRFSASFLGIVLKIPTYSLLPAENIAYGQLRNTGRTLKQLWIGFRYLIRAGDVLTEMGLVHQMHQRRSPLPVQPCQCACLDSDEATSSIDSRTE